MQSVLNGLSITGPDVNVPFALTDATTILVDASKGSFFRVTLGGNRTMGAPSNPTDGQMIMFEIHQDATGTRTLAWTLTTGGYVGSTTVALPTLTVTASKYDYVGFVYNSTANIWRCIAFDLA